MRISPGAASPLSRAAWMIDVAHGAVVVAALEADPAERGVAGGDPDPELEHVAAPPPSSASATNRSRIATARRTARAAWSGWRAGSLKNVMNPSPAKCSSVPSWATMSAPIAA